MAGTLPAGPLGMLPFGQRNAPFYMLPFDKTGSIQAPGTAARLMAEIADGTTDVVVIVHGWNNDWNAALTLCRGFVDAVDQVLTAHGDLRPGAKVVVAGVTWPSIAFPDASAPAMAAAPSGEADLAELSLLGDEIVPDDDRPEFYELLQAGDLDQDRALRLAQLLAPLYAGSDDDLTGDGGSDPAGTVAAWAAAQERLEDAEGPLVISGPTGPAIPDPGASQPGAPAAGPPAAPAPAAGPQAAGLLSLLDPRNIVRLATVLMMKDRAGVIGFRGLGPQLSRMLNARDGVKVHLVGHSYGCKVALSAVCSGISRNVRSVLLMQPALSFLALSDQVPTLGAPGGYQAAKRLSDLPILATWSRQDIPLHDLFALAVRRREDLGEQNIGAAGLQTPPSLFAAMGGWGPQAAPDVGEQKILRPGPELYPLTAGGRRVLALDGTGVITGHGAVVNDATAWALRDLMIQD